MHLFGLYTRPLAANLFVGGKKLISKEGGGGKYDQNAQYISLKYTHLQKLQTGAVAHCSLSHRAQAKTTNKISVADLDPVVFTSFRPSYPDQFFEI